jgi:chromosomal replication initiation ATPase DnaA
MIEIEDYSAKTEIPMSELMGYSRVPKIALAREAYWYYLKKRNYRLIDIAFMFNRTHPTILSGIRTIRNMIDTHDHSIIHYLEALEM